MIGNSTTPIKNAAANTTVSKAAAKTIDTDTPVPKTEDLMHRVTQGAHDTVDMLAATAAPAVNRIRKGVHQASETVQARADQLGEIQTEWADSLRTTVRERPLMALATALAIGVLATRLVSR